MAEDKAARRSLDEGDENGPSELRSVSASPVNTNEACCVREFWAVVDRNGSLLRGRNVWRVARLGQGTYEVVFTGDVDAGVYQATIGRGAFGTEPAGMIGTAARWGLTGPEQYKGVWVDTHDPGGQRADRGFHLVVHTQE